MKRFLAMLAFGVCAAGLAGPAAVQQPVFRGTTELVRVFVTVLDKEGRLVTNLTQDQFEVRDEGAPQPIALFDNTPQPVRLVLLLDVSGSMEGNLPLLRSASQQLFARLRPDDRVRVGSFGNEVIISETFTRDVGTLREALPDHVEPNAPTPLWRAMDVGLSALREEGEERPVVLVLSDGKDNPPLDFKHKAVGQGEVIDRARRDDVMIYGVGMRSRSRQRQPPGIGFGAMQQALLDEMPDPGLARVAEETGGGYAEIKYGEDLGEAFARVADELHGQYLLGFAPPKRDGKVHDITVRVAQKGLTPRARKSYVAPKR